MFALFINISVRNWDIATEEGIAMRFLIEPVYCMTWIWTLHRAHNKSKRPIEEDNIWANKDTDTHTEAHSQTHTDLDEYL